LHDLILLLVKNAVVPSITGATPIAALTNVMPSQLSLRPSTISQPFLHQGTFELGDTSHDLADRRTHRIVRIVKQDLSALGSENRGSSTPGDSKNRLLHIKSSG
jgi:hypothetical protein